MPFRIPESPAAFLRSAQELWVKLKDEKKKTQLAEGDWYPFDTLSCVPTVTELISPEFDVVAADIAGRPGASIGFSAFGPSAACWTFPCALMTSIWITISSCPRTRTV